MKRHTTVRLDKKTDELLKKLAELYGSQTNAIAIAIDRLAREELPEGKDEEPRSGSTPGTRSLGPIAH